MPVRCLPAPLEKTTTHPHRPPSPQRGGPECVPSASLHMGTQRDLWTALEQSVVAEAAPVPKATDEASSPGNSGCPGPPGSRLGTPWAGHLPVGPRFGGVLARWWALLNVGLVTALAVRPDPLHWPLHGCFRVHRSWCGLRTTKGRRGPWVCVCCTRDPGLGCRPGSSVLGSGGEVLPEASPSG